MGTPSYRLIQTQPSFETLTPMISFNEICCTKKNCDTATLEQIIQLAVVVSESAIVRIFDAGRLIAEIIPEVWLFAKEATRIKGPCREKTVGDVKIISQQIEK
jgi:DTW domain-containing protein YfiP